jgi:hypothetical protein
MSLLLAPQTGDVLCNIHHCGGGGGEGAANMQGIGPGVEAGISKVLDAELTAGAAAAGAAYVRGV